MKRRAFLKNSMVGMSGLAGTTYSGLVSGAAHGMSEAKAEHASTSDDKVGRPVRITSISFPNGLSLEEIAGYVDKAGPAGVDVIALPELARGQNDQSKEDLHGPTVTRMAALAKKYNTYIVCPIDRIDGNRRLNTVVLLDRRGEVACVYDKIFPYWDEFDVHPPVDVGDEAQVYRADFGLLGFATCFDVNFPEVWQRLADKGAEVVIWPSAYSAGTSLQAHALNHHYYIVSATQMSDCLVYRHYRRKSPLPEERTSQCDERYVGPGSRHLSHQLQYPPTGQVAERNTRMKSSRKNGWNQSSGLCSKPNARK